MTQCKVILEVDEGRCNRCGLCVDACRCNLLRMGEHGPVVQSAESTCALCDETDACACLCEEVCPTGALTVALEIVEGDKSHR